MVDKKTAKLLNTQINLEFYSAYLYLEISNYYSDKGLDGFANWFYVQMQEEVDHANLIRNYLLDNDEKIKLGAIGDPTTKLADHLAPLKAAYAHEKLITKSINDIYAVGIELKEFSTTQFLNWFIQEQVEEEKNTSDLITKYELFAGDSKGLYMLDQELATRVYVPITSTAI